MAVSPTLRKRIERKASEQAAQYRRELGLGIEPVADIFDLLERQGLIVLRYPVTAKGLSAFIARDEDDYVVFINTEMTLGRQIFSAAHELGHYRMDRASLTLNICTPGDFPDSDPVELAADCFAGAFLMPPEGIRKVFRERFGDNAVVTPREVIVLQHTFRVSYAAMTVALRTAGLITHPQYKRLREYGSPENAALLKSLVYRYGYTDELISPTGAQIPRVFLQALNANYEDGRLSYKKLKELLGMWQKTPEEMGFQFAADY
ncbi:ImmA/IrrE family metallo-endopeptidase [Desulforudis sp. DRI-14]|uniref:ImmA/IrrE family metallo-endopeptidase n=1 Tax=Desulforudis sp. DRI-14 TaxID=3459793 RepID=UPI003BE8B86E